MKAAFILINALLFVFFVSHANAQNIDNKVPSSIIGKDVMTSVKNPVIKLISPGLFEIGDIRLDKNSEQVEFKSVINMDKGLLEYILVEKTGKVHESLLRTDIEPYNLQIALLMLGLEGTSNPLVEQGDARTPEGDTVRIVVKWKDKTGKVSSVPVEKWINTKGLENSDNTVDWVFTGSIIDNGIFMAQADKSIIALYHDPIAMFDNKAPEGASDEVWFVNEKTVPANGTEVTVIIKKLKLK